jgi:hypothetical protein
MSAACSSWRAARPPRPRSSRDHPRLPRHSSAPRPDQSVQARLALNHGTVAWHTLPSEVRERVVTRWIELWRAHTSAAHSRRDRDA